MAGQRVAVVGATGLVGRTILRVLEERLFPVDDLVAVASERSVGTSVQFQGIDVEVRAPGGHTFDSVDIAFFSAGARVSRLLAPGAAESGALVVDNSSAFRLQPDVPLIVPEVNGDLLAGVDAPAIVANPNCSTAQMVVALDPLHRVFGLESVVVSTYQSVSGTGNQGLRALECETMGKTSTTSPYPHPIAFNVLPHIDVFDGAGWTGEERKIVAETRKIMRLPDLHVVPTAVRVPVRVGHAESVYARFQDRVAADDARRVLEGAPGVIVSDAPDSNSYPLPLSSEGHDEVYVGRIREDEDDPQALVLWVVGDNLRKGAATNAVQIVETWLSRTVQSPGQQTYPVT